MNRNPSAGSLVIKSELSPVDISSVDTKKFFCHFCSKTFKFYGKWKVHMRTHTRLSNKATILENRKVYTCPFCSKMFVMATNYRIHLKLHRKESMEMRVSSYTNFYSMELIKMGYFLEINNGLG